MNKSVDNIYKLFGWERNAVPAVKEFKGVESDVEVIDEVAVWLHKQGHVERQDGGWLVLECPQADKHTTGDRMARYSPLGAGKGTYAHSRGFKCFHEHCADLKTRDFLSWVADNGGPDGMRAYDPLPWLQQRYVYVADGRRIFDLAMLRSGGKCDYKLDEWADLYAGMRLWMPTSSDPKRTVTVRTAFIEDEQTIKCRRCAVVPGQGEFYDDGGEISLNLWRPPMHADGDSAGANVFIDHVQYLLPLGGEADIFLDWLAYKLQNPDKRAYGIVMVAEDMFGVGRSWVGDVLSGVWGAGQVADIDIGDLTGHGSGAAYNDWAAGAQLVVVEEAHSGDDAVHYRAYERIKTLIDPRTKRMQINRKYGSKAMETIYFNLLVFSNHADAFRIPERERRLAVLTNAAVERDSGYYGRLFGVLGRKLYADVYTLLMGRDVSKFNPAMPGMTEAKAVMRSESRGASEKVIDEIKDGEQELFTRDMLGDRFKDLERTMDVGDIPPAIRNRDVGRLWRRMGNLKPGDKNGLRTRFGTTKQVEVRTLKRHEYWCAWAADTERPNDETAATLKEEFTRGKGGLRVV